MEHHRGNWFVSGVALWLMLIGLGIACGYTMSKIAAANEAGARPAESLEPAIGNPDPIEARAQWEAIWNEEVRSELSGEVPSLATEAVHTRDLGTMTWEEARRLEGKHVRVWFFSRSQSVSKFGRSVSVESGAKEMRCVEFAAGDDPSSNTRREAVEGVIQTNIIPAQVVGGEKYPEERCICVVDAKHVRP